MLIVFTAIVGMLLAVQGLPNLLTVLAASAGIGLAASSGAAMNQIIDMRADAIMARTKNRPLATGGMAVWQAICFAALLCILGMFVLVVWGHTLVFIQHCLAWSIRSEAPCRRVAGAEKGPADLGRYRCCARREWRRCLG